MIEVFPKKLPNNIMVTVHEPVFPFFFPSSLVRHVSARISSVDLRELGRNSALARFPQEACDNRFDMGCGEDQGSCPY